MIAKDQYTMSRKRSSIWLYFSEISTDRAKCNTCQVTLSRKGGSVNNLSRHLKSKHPTIERERANPIENPDLEIVDEPESGVTNSNLGECSSEAAKSNENAGPSSLSQPVPKKVIQTQSIRAFCVSKKPLSIGFVKQVHKQLLKFIAVGYHPFSLIEEDEFKALVRLLNPKYELPSRKYLSNTLLEEDYRNCFERIMELVSQAQAIALTCDSWTNINNDSFFAVTAHFFDENYELRSPLLACKKFEERHTADNIVIFLQKVVETWKITNKVTAIVTDNAANIVAATRKCNWRHVPCLAHTLNLIVQAMLENELVKPLIRKVKGRF